MLSDINEPVFFYRSLRQPYHLWIILFSHQLDLFDSRSRPEKEIVGKGKIHISLYLEEHFLIEHESHPEDILNE